MASAVKSEEFTDTDEDLETLLVPGKRPSLKEALWGHDAQKQQAPSRPE